MNPGNAARLVIAAAVCLLAVARPGLARADDNDLVVSRLGVPNAMGTDIVPAAQSFRSLASELGVVLAPRLLAPSDTLGYGGFQFSADIAFTTISNNQPFWRVLESSDDPTNTDPNVSHGDANLPTLGFFVRKGIWLPLPSFEVGAGIVRLLDSSIYAAQAYAKLAVHEGYHDLPLPSVAVRGGASRVLGTDQIDLTIASLDVSVSKDIGIGGTFTASPYAGWNLLFIVPRSEVLDATPNIDQRDDPMDLANSFAFGSQDNITRNRFFGGRKLQHYIFALIFEANFALSGSSTDDVAGTDTPCEADPAPTAFCDAEDQAAAQQTYTISLALDF